MQQRRFRAFAWFLTAYLVCVILFGAWVRISGSGDGCGNHWPACNGSVIPQNPAAKTVIEYTHRLSTALCGLFTLALVVWARRLNRKLFRASLVVLFFLVVESLLGALLVKRHLVMDNATIERVWVVALHLANTLLLAASAATVAWLAGSRAASAESKPEGAAAARAKSKPAGLLLGLALLLLLLTNMTGAVTALGDTVFPTQPALDSTLLARLSADASAGQHFLVRLRVIHPVVAVVAVLVVALMLMRVGALRGAASKLALAACGVIFVQLILGVFNVALAAPGWLQIVHLLAAQAVWLLVWVAWLEQREARAG